MLVKRIEIEKEQVRLVYKMDIRPFERGPERGFSKDCTLRPIVAHPPLSKNYFLDFPRQFPNAVAQHPEKPPHPRNTTVKGRALMPTCTWPEHCHPKRRPNAVNRSTSAAPPASCIKLCIPFGPTIACAS
jgi:hypothetical protein